MGLVTDIRDDEVSTQRKAQLALTTTVVNFNCAPILVISGSLIRIIT